MSRRKQPTPSINLFYYTMQTLCVVSFLAQLAIDSRIENLTANAFSLLGSTIIIQYLIRSQCAHESPVSTLALIGLNITSLLTSMVSMSAYGLPLIEKLRAPEITFPLLAAVQVLAVGSHWIFRHFVPFQSATNAIATQILQPVGAFAIPHIATIWIMGIIGVASQYLGHANTGDVSGKAVQALGFLCWMPFLIPFYYNKAGDRFCNLNRQIPFIIAFVSAMVLIGMARNIRQIMMIGPLQLIFALFLYAAVTRASIGKGTVKKYISAFVLLFAMTAATSDLVTAMAVAREKRDTSTHVEIIEETMNVLFVDRHRIEQYRAKTDLAAQIAAYDEAYIPNPVLLRLSETKFHDNMLYFGSKYFSDDTSTLLDGMRGKAISILPETLIKIFDKNYVKNDYVFTMGDYYLYLLWGEQRLSNFVTGSIWADFYTLLGEWFIFVVPLYLILLFIILDSLTMRGNIANVSAIAICTSWPIFIYGIGGESIVSKATFLFREIPQRVILYGILFWSITWIQGLLGLRQPKEIKAS